MKKGKSAAIPPRAEEGARRLLEEKTWSSFSGGETGKGLGELCLSLLSEQRQVWPDLRRGCRALEKVREREIACRGFAVKLQYNPERIANTLAGIGERKEGGPACFLCPGNLPAPQRGIRYRKNYLILCNPRPIFPAHFTVAHVKHRPQALGEETGAYFRLVADFGPGWTVFYNGPRCGASAPDHLHFQAAPAGRMPIERELSEKGRIRGGKWSGGVFVGRLREGGREAALLEGRNPAALESAFRALLKSLGEVLKADGEPMVNVAGFQEGGKIRLLIFPRRKHRPDAFFLKGRSRIMVSPGLIDMGGLVITPVEKDFKNLAARDIAGIYKEVSLEAGIFQEALELARSLGG